MPQRIETAETQTIFSITAEILFICVNAFFTLQHGDLKLGVAHGANITFVDNLNATSGIYIHP